MNTKKSHLLSVFSAQAQKLTRLCLWSSRKPYIACTATRARNHSVLPRNASILLLGFALTGCSVIGESWSSTELRARVVTPDGKPIGGAVVLATWSVDGWINNARLGQLAIDEAVTNEQGEFYIPGWEHRRVSGGMVNESEPTVRIFHPGFIPRILTNVPFIGMRSAPSVINFRFQDQSIVMTPFNGELIDYERALLPLNSALRFIIFDPSNTPSGRCYWKAIPKTLIALEKNRIDLQRQGGGEMLNSLKDYVMADKPACGNPKEQFHELLE